MMRKTFAAILSAAAAWLLLIAMLLAGVFICTTSTAFYRHEYKKYDNAATIGISDEGLMEVTDVLLDYLWGSRDNLDMQAEIQGETREVFTQREKDHMVDVRFLIQLARIALIVALPCGLALWLIAVLLVHREKGGLKFAGIGYLAGAALLFVCVGIVVLLAMQDFTAVFIKFHEIFFTNDLWLLSADDMLIMMVPEPFFVDCASLIAIVFAVGLILTAGISLFMILHKGKKNGSGSDTITEISGADGDNFYKIAEDSKTVRPDADEIFARMGLDESEEEAQFQQETPVTEVPEKAAETNSDLRTGSDSVVRSAAAEFPVRMEDGNELSVRFEMNLDLKVEKSEDGKLVLTMDPGRKPQVTLSSKPGQLNFSIYDEPAALPVPEEISAPERLPMQGPVPSPEELLKQMDELMKGFPGGKEGDA